MNDLSDKISELLSDPSGMEKIRQMASSLLGDAPPEAPPASLPSALPALPEGLDLTKIIPLVSRLSSQKDNKRTALLLSLRPHLSDERRERLDKAVQLLKLYDMLPLLKDSGILTNLF